VWRDPLIRDFCGLKKKRQGKIINEDSQFKVEFFANYVPKKTDKEVEIPGFLRWKVIRGSQRRRAKGDLPKKDGALIKFSSLVSTIELYLGINFKNLIMRHLDWFIRPWFLLKVKKSYMRALCRNLSFSWLQPMVYVYSMTFNCFSFFVWFFWTNSFFWLSQWVGLVKPRKLEFGLFFSGEIYNGDGICTYLERARSRFNSMEEKYT